MHAKLNAMYDKRIGKVYVNSQINKSGLRGDEKFLVLLAFRGVLFLISINFCRELLYVQYAYY